MSDVLSPSLALAYLAELQPRLQAAAVLDQSGRVLAGTPPAAPTAAVDAARGGYALSVSGTPALASLLRLDLDSVLADLAGEGGE